MDILIIISGHEFTQENLQCIHSLKRYIINNKKFLNKQVDVALICSNKEQLNAFDNHLSNIKYKICNSNKQLSKICDFISELKESYTWYIKVRPDIELLSPIRFKTLDKNAINARCRQYIGNRRIPYGSSLNGAWLKEHYNSIIFCDIESKIVLDDQIYIFHNNIAKQAFQKIQDFEFEEGFSYDSEIQNENLHTFLWLVRKIKLNPYGINLVFHNKNLRVNDIYSNHINMMENNNPKSSQGLPQL